MQFRESRNHTNAVPTYLVLLTSTIVANEMGYFVRQVRRSLSSKSGRFLKYSALVILGQKMDGELASELTLSASPDTEIQMPESGFLQLFKMAASLTSSSGDGDSGRAGAAPDFLLVVAGRSLTFGTFTFL